MAKKKAETAVTEKETTAEPHNLIGAAVEHMTLAAKMLRSKGGEHADACAYIATELERRIPALEKMNE